MEVSMEEIIGRVKDIKQVADIDTPAWEDDSFDVTIRVRDVKFEELVNMFTSKARSNLRRFKEVSIKVVE
jgi:hypothetical protein